MTVHTGLNDVDLAAVGALATAIQDDPAKAGTTWAAHVSWHGGFRSSARVRGFAPIPSDEPTALGGGDSAPNPVEQLLAALGNCLAVGYAANAAAAGIRIDALNVDVKGDIDLRVFLGLAEGHAGFGSITAEVSITSPAPSADLAALHAKVTASSPVGHTLAAPVPVAIELVERRQAGEVTR
ncbi:OsmC family protein [Actinokineospora sp. NPDC004072]